MNVDRITIRQTVEDAFRSQLLFQQNYIGVHPHSSPKESQDAAYDFFQRWYRRIEESADLMPPEQGAAYKELVEEEVRFLIQEFNLNPQGLYQRLGVAMGRLIPQFVCRRQGLGELAVRTAVRATVLDRLYSDAVEI